VVQLQIVIGPSPHKEVRLSKSDQLLPFKPWSEIELIIKRGNLSEEEQQIYWDCLFLDETQVQELLTFFQENASYPFIHPAVAIATFTGARRSEIIRSKIEDWDFESGIVRIRGRKDSRTHRTTLRDVVLHPKLREIMQGWFEGQHPGGSHAIAVVENDKPRSITKDQAHHHFKETLSKGKWKVVRGWHVLRHSFCSNCARRGVPDPIIDRWVGHQGNEAVKQRYRHFFTSDQHNYMGKVYS
jgi:integrase